MQELNVFDQAWKLTIDLQNEIGLIPPSDPLKPWFLVQSELLGVFEAGVNQELGETTARITAMRQLGHLVFQHRAGIELPHVGRTESEEAASFLTVQARMPENVLDSTRKLHFSIEPSLLHSPTEEQNFDSISPTAKVVSHLRGWDPVLKLSPKCELDSDGKQILDDLDVRDEETKHLMAVLFQSRYHAINAAIQQNQTPQTIEFASGISPRGLQWSQGAPGTIYVESDLPQLMVQKAKLVRNLLIEKASPARGLLHCCGVNVLDFKSVSSVLNLIDINYPVSLVTEGLLLYFDASQLRQFLKNISQILNQCPKATWVTDIVTQADFKQFLANHLGVAKSVQRIFELTGRQVVHQNPFVDEHSLRQLLREFDLRIEGKVSLNSTLKALNFKSELNDLQKSNLVGDRTVFRIRHLDSSADESASSLTKTDDNRI